MFKLTISRLLIVFGLIVCTGLISALAIQNLALYRLKIEGPLYNGIVKQKDFIADILPPPLFVVEPYATAYEARFHPEKREADLKRIGELKKEYDGRRAFWLANALDSEQEALLKSKLLAAADRFWTVMLDEYIPVVGQDYVNADPILNKLAAAYHEQWRAVIELSELTAENIDQRGQDAAAEAAKLSSYSIAAGSAAVFLFVAGVIYLRRKAISPLVSITARMRELADGGLDGDIPHVDRTDEIGDIAHALLVFQRAGIAKRDMEREAEAATISRREKRLKREAEAQQRTAEIAAVVEQLGGCLQRLSECNISRTIDAPFAPDFESIRRDFNQSIATFQLTIEKVMSGAMEIRDGSTELSAAADSIAHRTEQQAAALEQTSAALAEINGTIANLTVSTEATRKLVSDARDRAGTSGKVVNEAVQAMQRIEKSASEIGQIIGVIDEIAFQTNLLALNAGVEAARAGESGKGFAVVAAEVRELAQRSAVAAKQIKALVSNSSQEVGEGVKLVGETGRALSEIINYVATIDINIEQIATGVREQSAGVSQTTEAVHVLDGSTQQNAAMAEEASALSKSLADQASMLSSLVEKFKLNRRAAIREPGSAAARAAPRRTDAAA